jgi:co-chaperonin GroES (HSP10)
VIQMTQDNVLIAFDKLEEKTSSGVIIPGFEYVTDGKHKGEKQSRHTLNRWATVLSVGPGHNPGCKKCGNVRKTFIPTQVKVGDRVLVPANTGEDYSLDVSAPRHHTQEHKFSAFEGYENAELRIVREGQIMAIAEEA